MTTASRFFINKQSYKFTISNTMHKLPRTYRIPSFEECWTSSPRWRSERLMCLCFIHRIIHYYHFHQFSNWFHQLFNETQVNIFKITNTTWRYKRTPSLTYYHRHRASMVYTIEKIFVGHSDIQNISLCHAGHALCDLELEIYGDFFGQFMGHTFCKTLVFICPLSCKEVCLCRSFWDIFLIFYGNLR